MPFVQAELAQLGGTESHNGEFRAHMQFRGEANKNVNIRGPNRTTQEQAQKDLEEIRKAAEKAETREEGLEMMRDEAQRLKNSAQYEAEIQETLRRRDSMMDESDYEDDDMTEGSDPPWIEEYTEYTEEPPQESQAADRPTLSPIEATAELSRFRPLRSTPSDLKHLLEARADSNMPVKPGDISPLRKVMSFAKMDHVAEMRDLLLQYDANESDEDRARWELRRRADFCERIRINNYNNIDKDYDPLSGGVEY